MQHLRLTTGLESTGSDVLQISTLYFKHILEEAENISYSYGANLYRTHSATRLLEQVRGERP